MAIANAHQEARTAGLEIQQDIQKENMPWHIVLQKKDYKYLHRNIKKKRTRTCVLGTEVTVLQKSTLSEWNI